MSAILGSDQEVRQEGPGGRIIISAVGRNLSPPWIVIPKDQESNFINSEGFAIQGTNSIIAETQNTIPDPSVDVGQLASGILGRTQQDTQTPQATTQQIGSQQVSVAPDIDLASLFPTLTGTQPSGGVGTGGSQPLGFRPQDTQEANASAPSGGFLEGGGFNIPGFPGANATGTGSTGGIVPDSLTRDFLNNQIFSLIQRLISGTVDDEEAVLIQTQISTLQGQLDFIVEQEAVAAQNQRAEEDRQRQQASEFGTQPQQFGASLEFNQQNALLNALLSQQQTQAGQQSAAIGNPFGAFALNLLGGNALGQPGGLTSSSQQALGGTDTSNLLPGQINLLNQQHAPDLSGVFPGLGSLGFNIPQGSSFGQQQDLSSFFTGGLPTIGAFNQAGPDATSLVGSVAGATGTSPEELQRRSQAITPQPLGR